MDKKDREAAWLQAFKECLTDFPQRQVEKTENPDFLVHAPSGIIGIEMTLLHRQTSEGRSPMQEQESLRRLILAKAMQMVEASGQPPVHVSPHFNTNYRIRRSDVDWMAEKVAALILDDLAGHRA